MNANEIKLRNGGINSYSISGLTAVKQVENNNVSINKIRFFIVKLNKKRRNTIRFSIR